VRRSICSFSRFFVFVLLVGAATHGITRIEAQASSVKKGIAEWSAAANTISQSNVSWYYDWRAINNVTNPPRGVQFIPMIWGASEANVTELIQAKNSGAGILLTFNEPDVANQSNLTPAQAISYWPRFEAQNMKLGSPCVASDATQSNSWLAQFMSGAQAAKYRVDFICLHAYQGNFDPTIATQDLIRYVTRVHDKYGLPIWITEYALADWGGGPETPNITAQAAFARYSAPALEMIPWVERYAWYGDVNDSKQSWSTYLNGTETAVGSAWRLAPLLK